MKAAVFKGTGQALAIEDIPDPIPGPRDLIMKVADCGICGSDLHMTEPGPFTIPGGAVMGHEFAGEVVAVGKEMAGRWKEGDRITALPYIACGQCARCLRGDGFRCDKVEAMGLGQVPGAYAEYARVGGDQAFRLPASVSFREGAMVEPLAVGLHAVNKARLERGAAILIIGAGPVGLSVALWARFFGVQHVVVSERAAARRDMALRFGATHVLDGGMGVSDQFQKIAGRPPDIIFECVGAPGVLQETIMLAPSDGQIIVVGVCSQPDTIMPVMAILKEIDIRFVLAYRPADFRFVIDMIASNRIDALLMLTDTVGFDGFPSAFEALRKPAHQCKVLLEPHGPAH